MKVVIKHEMNRIKNGYSARSVALGLTAHGFSEEVARRNLERMVRFLLTPFERSNTLEGELQKMGLDVYNDGDGLTISLA